MNRTICIIAVCAMAGCGGTTTPSASNTLNVFLPPTQQNLQIDDAPVDPETETDSASPQTENALLVTEVDEDFTSPVIDNTPIVPEPDADFASLLNTMRLDNGAGAVTHNDLLDQAAQDYAVVMIENNHFSHTGPDGSTLRERVDATGYDWTNIGENLGRGQQNEEQIMEGWTDSPGHHANNINPVFEEFGLGFTRDGLDTRWVLVLGTPR